MFWSDPQINHLGIEIDNLNSWNVLGILTDNFGLAISTF